jgi:hypothetical protein
MQFGNAEFCSGKSFSDAMRGGAPGNIVAIERGFDGNAVKEIFGELGREGLEVGER